MKISSIKTCFQILGAAISIVAVFCFLIVLADSPGQTDGETVIALFLGLFLAGTAIYCFAGAPHVTKAIKRRFPSEGYQKQSASNPRHKLKAILGICTGLAMGIVPLLLILFDLLTQQTREEFGGFFLAFMFFAPALSTWGSAHLSWHRRVSPMIPVVAGGFCCVIMWLMAATQNPSLLVTGYTLLTIAPVLVVVCLKGRSRPMQN